MLSKQEVLKEKQKQNDYHSVYPLPKDQNMHLCKLCKSNQLTFKGDKTLWNKDKMLVTSIFTYFHVFKQFLIQLGLTRNL